MKLFNNPELDIQAGIIKEKVDKVNSPNNIVNISENGIYICNQFLKDSLPILDFIKNKVGVNNENYVFLSEAIAVTASGCIKGPVSYMWVLVQASDFKRQRQLVIETQAKLAEATRLMGIISALAMRPHARELVNKVNFQITGIERKLSSSSGCFIATFAFDDYNASEVLFLRYFRDNILEKSTLGKLFIRVYYIGSPYLVIVFKKIPGTKMFFRRLISTTISFFK